MPNRALSALMLLAACASGATDEPAPVTTAPPAAAVGEARVTAGPLAATLRLESAAVRVGDSVRVRFALTNRTAAPVAVMLSCSAPAYLALVPAAGGEPVDATACAQVITERTLAPGAEEVMTAAFRAPRAGRFVVEAAPTAVAADGRPVALDTLRAGLDVR